MRRLVWVGVGVVLTVVVIRKGRAIAEAYLPEGSTDVVDAATRIGRALGTARREFSAGLAEREAQLRHDLVGDLDVDAVRAARGEHVDAVRSGWADATGRPRPSGPRGRQARSAPSSWKGPVEDPDDDDGYAFF